jgi:AraC-like DNA-binding protein
MGNFVTKTLATVPSAVGTITRLACACAEDEGVEVENLLQQAGLSREHIDDKQARLEVRSQIRFLDLVAKSVDDDHLGFHLARNYDLREGGFLYYVLASSDRLGKALQRGARYSSVVNEGIRLALREGKRIELVVEYVDVARPFERHQIEFLIVTVVRICRQITGRHLIPHDITFTHACKATSEMNTFFGREPRFGAETDAVTFSSSIRDIPAVNADPFLNDLLVKYFEETLARRKETRKSFGLGVENALATLLPHGKGLKAEVARKLGVSERTLARRLSSEGLTFAGVLQTLRSDLAKRHLDDQDLSVSVIAWMLGYQNVSAFTNAFKRWNGKPPRASRRALP